MFNFLILYYFSVQMSFLVSFIGQLKTIHNLIYIYMYIVIFGHAVCNMSRSHALIYNMDVWIIFIIIYLFFIQIMIMHGIKK